MEVEIGDGAETTFMDGFPSIRTRSFSMMVGQTFRDKMTGGLALACYLRQGDEVAEIESWKSCSTIPSPGLVRCTSSAASADRSCEASS